MAIGRLGAFTAVCALAQAGACRARGAPPEPPPAPLDESGPRAPDAGARRQPEAGAPETLALFRRFPALGRAIPRVRLGSFPTPVELAARLGDRLGMKHLYIKRDDLSSEVYGGGKPRKLELILAEAKASGATRVVVTGGVGSNQAVATTVFARQLGLGTTLLLVPQPSTRTVRANLLADRLFGADMRLVGSQSRAQREADRLASSSGGDTYAIAPGGSSPLGNVGFVNAGLELAEQAARGELPPPDFVYVAMGTMGSAVGLSIGLQAADLPTRVVAVRASNAGTSTRSKLEALFRATVAFVRDRDPTFPAVEPTVDHIAIDGRHLGRGYAARTRRGEAAIELYRRVRGVELEPTYTAKAFAAIVTDAPLRANDVVVFWDTHSGAPLDVRTVGFRSLPGEFHPYFVGRDDAR